jgi:hypothetical protein
MNAYRGTLLHKLGLAEIYLGDGAPQAALRCIHDAMEMASPDLPDSEDLGDVSDHLLRAAGVKAVV